MKVPLLFVLCATLAYGGSPDKVAPPILRVQAVRLTRPITIDGLLNEPDWQKAPVFSTFRQSEPNQGAEATLKTEVRILYDDAAIYVGARMYDPSPDSIMPILSRRDQYPVADWFGVFLDAYHDQRTGNLFALSAGGSVIDGVLYNDDWNDNSWDGVWQGRSHIDKNGWTAEMRIPYSQLRFHDSKTQVWGINFQRDIGRKRETDCLVYTPRNQSGFVSRFGELVGISNIHPPSRVEVLPYVTEKGEYTHPAANDPFNDGSRYSTGAGADFKIGLGNNVTLNGTVNPDFGQVEVDPAVVNLSDVESYFDEKRPFFLEGATIFNFGQGGARNYWSFNWPQPTLFYSRRIGRAPQGSVPDADFADVPQATHILGAAKLTGKVIDGWNVGAIEAVTQREIADLDTTGHKFHAEVEPAAYYGVLRAQKDFNDSKQGLGFISTVSARDFSDPRLRDDLNSNSEVLGMDGWTFLDADKVWVVSGWAGLSHVEGDSARMLSLQTNSQHYFQRPDAPYLGVDSSITSMTGYGARISLNKNKGKFFANSALGILSPGFDVNDLGFQSRSDVINMHAGCGYSWSDPGKVFRYAETGGALFQNYDYGGNVGWRGFFEYGNLEFLNYYWFNWNVAYNPTTVNNTRTRGGPLTLNPPGRQLNLDVTTDTRQKWDAEVSMFTYQSIWERDVQEYVAVSWRPVSNVSLSVAPMLDHDYEAAQWVTSTTDPTASATYGGRYIFADMLLKTLSASIRLNWTFTPTLSLQLYLQPLISSGDYTHFKELARPRSFDFTVYGTGSSTLAEVKSADGSVSFTADPDGPGPAPPITFSNPDFNTKSLRGNAVLRWEFVPGSVAYLVWTQTRFNQTTIDGNFELQNSVDRLFTTVADNIFLVKFSYWFNV